MDNKANKINGWINEEVERMERHGTSTGNRPMDEKIALDTLLQSGAIEEGTHRHLSNQINDWIDKEDEEQTKGMVSISIDGKRVTYVDHALTDEVVNNQKEAALGADSINLQSSKSITVPMELSPEGLDWAKETMRTQEEVEARMDKIVKEGGEAIIGVTSEALASLLCPGYKAFAIRGLPKDILISAVYFDQSINQFQIHCRSLEWKKRTFGDPIDIFSGDIAMEALTESDYILISRMKYDHPSKSLSEILGENIKASIKDWAKANGIDHEVSINNDEPLVDDSLEEEKEDGA